MAHLKTDMKFTSTTVLAVLTSLAILLVGCGNKDADEAVATRSIEEITQEAIEMSHNARDGHDLALLDAYIACEVEKRYDLAGDYNSTPTDAVNAIKKIHDAVNASGAADHYLGLGKEQFKMSPHDDSIFMNASTGCSMLQQLQAS